MSYKIYKNVIKMITFPEYRGLILDSSELKESMFTSTIHLNNCVLIKCREKTDKLSGKDISTIAFYITSSNSGITRTVIEFKKLMNKVQKGTKCIYIISDKDFSQQVYNTMSLLYPQYTVIKLGNTMFEDERPKHMLVPKHEILTEDEYNKLVRYSTIVSPLNLPKIRMDDTQCIWIGANPKDIIKITRHTIIGESINYRVVIGPISHKIKSDYNPKFMMEQEIEKNLNKKIIITKEDIVNKKKEKNIKKMSHEFKMKIKPKKIK